MGSAMVLEDSTTISIRWAMILEDSIIINVEQTACGNINCTTLIQLFYPEDGGSMFSRIVGKHLPDCMALRQRRQRYSNIWTLFE
jgi:hypothetical protein